MMSAAMPDLDELVSALTSSWNAIRARHDEVPPVVMVVGSDRRKAKLPCLGGFVAGRWSPVHAREPPRVQALREEFDAAVARGDLVAALGASGETLLIRALQLSADATRILDEVFITDLGLSGSSADVLGILLPLTRSPTVARSRTPPARGATTTPASERSPTKSG
jgi:hypothetical protein